MNKFRNILLFFTLVLSVLPCLAQVPVGKDMLFVYNLRTQYRRFSVSFQERGDTLQLDWALPRDGKIQRGSYAMSPENRQHAVQICYIMPAPDSLIETPARELFAMLSTDALRDVRSTGKCRYNNTVLEIVGTSVSSAVEPAKSLIHLKDFDEGYEMWVRDDERFPLIEKMINNPVEIDWEVKGVDN